MRCFWMTLPGCFMVLPIFFLLMVILGFGAGNSSVVYVGMIFLAICGALMLGGFIAFKADDYKKDKQMEKIKK